MTRTRRALVALATTASPLVAVAQPAPPTPPPVVITMGADGTPTVSSGAPAAPTGYYHYDQAGLDPTEETFEVYGGPTPELHVVTRGDTLWAICWYYFNDPWQWPKVWAYNPQITNPHWIYPGDLVRLLPRGFIAAVTSLDAAQLDPDEVKAGDGDAPPPTPTRAVELSVRQVAFIDKKHLESSWRVVGAVDERELLSLGDEVYISYPGDDVPQVGKRYSIYQADEPVAGVGSYVRIQGEVQIVAVKQDKRARARIVRVTGEIERGARVGPLMTQFKNVPPVKNTVDATGTIVAMLARVQLIGQGEVVFLDVGSDQGVKVGNRMYVVRRGDAFDPVIRPEDMVGQNNQRFPARALGEVVLIQVDEKLSIGLVTLAVEEMGVGDRVMMRKQ
ncbi:MAG: LysM peptidoglycan-binding domain-containing protein [Myxococcales bacterium]|nr:LysM peptidoglycan-binding domain-containing protein [Myxococcales bacterium]